MGKRQMGPLGPIRGRREPPPLAHGAKAGAHPPYGAPPPLPFGLVPHGKLEEGGNPPWPI